MNRVALAFLLLIPFCLANSLALAGSLDGSGAANLVIKAYLPDAQGKEVYLNLSGTAESVIVKDRTGLELQSRMVQEGNSTAVYATVPFDYLQFEMVSDSFTTKQGSLWNLDFSLGTSEDISELNSSLSLPKGAILKSTNGAVQGSGDSLVILWNAQNLDPAHKAHFKASYELTPQDDSSLLVWLGLIAALAYVAIAYFRKRRRQPPVPPQGHGPEKQSTLESNDVFKTLDETDKEIIREIHAQKGKTTQAHLYLHTHVPKATLSRRLASLESRCLIRKSQKGNRNLITLADLFKS